MESHQNLRVVRVLKVVALVMAILALGGRTACAEDSQLRTRFWNNKDYSGNSAVKRQDSTTRPIALINAVIFFAGWMMILWAGADHPPPPRFLAMVPLVLLAAGLVYWRLPVYLKWMETGEAGRLFNVAGEGILAGLIFAALGILLSRILGGGEPGVEQSVADATLWFVVLAAVGAGNALVIYLVNLGVRSRKW